MRGRWWLHQGIPVRVTYHPAYLLRNYTPDARMKVWDNVKEVVAKLRRTARGAAKVKQVHTGTESGQTWFQSTPSAALGGGTRRKEILKPVLASAHLGHAMVMEESGLGGGRGGGLCGTGQRRHKHSATKSGGGGDRLPAPAKDGTDPVAPQKMEPQSMSNVREARPVSAGHWVYGAAGGGV